MKKTWYSKLKQKSQSMHFPHGAINNQVRFSYFTQLELVLIVIVILIVIYYILNAPGSSVPSLQSQ